MEAGSQGAIKSGSHSRWCLFVISCPETTPRVRPMLEWEQAFGIHQSLCLWCSAPLCFSLCWLRLPHCGFQEDHAADHLKMLTRGPSRVQAQHLKVCRR